MATSRTILLKVLRTTVAAIVALGLTVSCLSLVLLGIGPMTGSYRLLTVRSGSMRPTIPVGALVVETARPLSRVQVGDIITFHLPTDTAVLETHRVVSILQTGPRPVVRTKGDANRQADPWRLRLLTGPVWRVRMVVPGIGSALAWWREPLVADLSVMVAPALLAVFWIRAIWRRGDTAPDLAPVLVET